MNFGMIVFFSTLQRIFKKSPFIGGSFLLFKSIYMLSLSEKNETNNLSCSFDFITVALSEIYSILSLHLNNHIHSDNKKRFLKNFCFEKHGEFPGIRQLVFEL